MHMERFLALLRGINISGKNQIAMPELKTACTDAGLLDVRTYLNSGNVLFTADSGDPDRRDRRTCRESSDSCSADG